VDFTIFRAMPDTLEFQELIAKLRDFAAAEYQRGERDAIARIMRAAQSSGARPPEHRTISGAVAASEASDIALARGEVKEERAPKGAPEALVRRVLTSVGSEGVAASDIPTFAKTDAERMVSNSAIRLMLSKGRESGLYQNMRGKWFLKGKEGKN
jgi:hypothetical protein